VGEGSGHLVIADVNRDGKPDLIAQHLLQRAVTVHLGDGAGKFAAATGSPIKLAAMPGDIKLGDVNGDGSPDLCVAQGDRKAVEVFLNNGGGRFSPAPGSPFPVRAPEGFILSGLELIDLNEDGKLDLVTTSDKHNSFGALLGDGRGGFAAGPTTKFPAGSGNFAFAFGDLDGDGRPDVAITNSGGGEFLETTRVIVMSGDGKGSFRLLSETDAPVSPRYLTLGDMNGDGRPDLVFVHGGNRRCGVSVLLNEGGGKFKPGPGYDLGAEAFGVAVADVNQDKRNDLIVASVDSVTVLLGGEGSFGPATGSPFRAGPGAYHLALGDINRDGKMDIAASSFEGATATVLLGK
jgi:hypothetical protein